MVGHAVTGLQCHLSSPLGLSCTSTQNTLPGPSGLLCLHAGNLVRCSSPSGQGTPYSLGLASSAMILPACRHRPCLILSLPPKLSGVFIFTPHPQPVGGPISQRQEQGVSMPPAPELPLPLPHLSSGMLAKFPGWGVPSTKSLPSSWLGHICPLWLPEDFGFCDSKALNGLLFALLSALSHLPQGNMCRHAKLTGQRWAKRKKEMPREQKPVNISKYFITFFF